MPVHPRGSDADGQHLTDTVVQQPVNGLRADAESYAGGEGSGTWLYRPKKDFVGTDTITFFAAAPTALGSNTVSVSINVVPRASGPRANDQWFAVSEQLGTSGQWAHRSPLPTLPAGKRHVTSNAPAGNGLRSSTQPATGPAARLLVQFDKNSRPNRRPTDI